jgi:hypothetical protein
MAKSQTSRRDEQHELTRRALIKWSVAAGAALGVSRSKIFDILEGTAGKGVAFAAAEHATTRSVHIADGNGGGAWYQLFWPQVDVALAANPQFAYHKPGMAKLVPGTANPLASGPDTPWANLPAQRQVTAFLAGTNETHTRQPQSPVTLNGNNIFAIATALQSSSPSVVPVVTINDAKLGTAPGAAAAANVANADGIVGLFNSAASRAGGLLAKTTDAQLYRAHFDAFFQLNRAASRSTVKPSFLTADGAATFLGTNLAAKLQVTPDDLTRYGVNAARTNVVQIARALIITVKAFKMGLANSVVLPGMGDDPHGAFTSGDVNTVPAQLKGVFDAFMDDLTRTVDDSTQVALADDTVITFTTDTTKDVLVANGWPDNTQANTNVVYVYSAGHLKSGWFGSIDRNGTVQGFGADGKPTTYNGANTAKFATASIAYAIAKRDERAISTFANGTTIGGIFGNLKDK